MDDIDELLWNCGGDGSSITTDEWQRILDHIFSKLCEFFDTRLEFEDEASIGNGFAASFQSVTAIQEPLAIRIRGTFGVDFPGKEYPCVQGFVYVYSEVHRLVSMNGENHIYIRYARDDAADDDWDMRGFTGQSAWSSYGWSKDEYGEFEDSEWW